MQPTNARQFRLGENDAVAAECCWNFSDVGVGRHDPVLLQDPRRFTDPVRHRETALRELVVHDCGERSVKSRVTAGRGGCGAQGNSNRRRHRREIVVETDQGAHGDLPTSTVGPELLEDEIGPVRNAVCGRGESEEPIPGGADQLAQNANPSVVSGALDVGECWLSDSSPIRQVTLGEASSAPCLSYQLRR